MGTIVTCSQLKAARLELRRQSRTLVFTNGVFDIIHRGHVEYLLRARALGDALAVGVNSDASVKRIKGDRRPIVRQDDRAFVLAHLSPVDYVCLFDEDTPLGLIGEIVPDVLVKGADWKMDEIVGREVVERAGGTVATIDFVPDRSSSGIIERIIERYAAR